MHNISGLALANTILNINPKTFIIFQTAYEKYALKAFPYGGMDYLLKPLSKESLKGVIKKIKKYLIIRQDRKKFLVKRGNIIYLIEMDDIYYIKADLDKVIIKIKDDDAYIRKNW